MSQKLRVALAPLRSSFINLPTAWASALANLTHSKTHFVFKLSWDNDSRSAYVSWSGGIARPRLQSRVPGAPKEEDLEIDGAYAAAIGLDEGTLVSIEYCRRVPTCTFAEVIPRHYDDWEVIELNAGVVEERLLAQTRLISPNQPIVFWLNASTSIVLNATQIMPDVPVALLDNDSEIAVAPRRRTAINVDTSRLVGTRDETDGASAHCMRLALSDQVALGECYINSEVYAKLALPAPDGGPQIAILSLIRLDLADDDSKHSPDDKEGDSDRVRSALHGRQPSMWYVNGRLSKHVQPGVALVSSRLAMPNGLVGGQVVVVQRHFDDSAAPAPVQQQRAVITFETSQEFVTESVIRRFLKDMVNKSPLPLISGMRLSLILPDEIAPGRLWIIVKSITNEQGAADTSEQQRPFLVTDEILSSVVIKTHPMTADLDESAPDLDTAIPALSGVDKFIDELKRDVMTSLIMSDRGILITGRQGSGKSSILRILAHHMATQSTILAYTRFVKCAELGGIQRTKTLRARIERLFRQARLNAPSVIALDDVDLLVSTDNEQSDSRRNRQIIETLVSVARERISDRPILVLATAASRSHVNSRAFDLGLFGDVQEIPPPGKQERENILAAIAKEGPIPPDLGDIKFSVISYLTEGYMPADLKALYERACHEAVVRAVDSRAQEQSMVLHRDIVRAHEGFTPLSMRGVQLHSSETSWDDIGGLEDTKRILKETIELPSRYAAIFASSPLRLRSGVMLYGYPGCGKTMLASAVAKECGLNFISVKGPELLNKYIGQSEQSVRDLFQRAKAASPCVLFFDEFDSIAPRRGHDNTGVTDRVVNQFLTEMDGAEGLEGVYVLAATSRPDLIDPALLRPGRLDKSVFCGMPDSKERLEILSKHARKLNLDPSVDLNDYVDATEHYTSADLQALVYNAFLGAVHDYQAAGQKGGSAQSSSAEHNEDDGDNIEYVVHDPLAKEGISRGLDGSEIAKLLRQMRLDIERPAASPTPEHSVDQQPSQPRMMPKHFERALQDSKSTLNQTERDRLQSIYENFLDDKGQKGMPPSIDQRATLA